MKDKIIKSIRALLLIGLPLLLSCATTPQIPYSPLEELKTNLGTIGVVSASFQPEVSLDKPKGKGAAAWHGAGVGAALVASAGNGCYGIGCAGVLAAISVGAAIGSIVGAVMGIPKDKIRETEEALNRYLVTLNFQETMRERFLSTARGDTSHPFISLEAQGPLILDEEVVYDSLPDKGIDTVLEISVRRCSLWGKKDVIDPFLRLRMAVGIRLIRLTDAKVIYSKVFIDEWGEPFKFSDWGADDALQFREAVNRSFQYLATEIVETISNIQTPPDPQASEWKKGS
jgi:hypothetical protein